MHCATPVPFHDSSGQDRPSHSDLSAVLVLTLGELPLKSQAYHANRGRYYTKPIDARQSIFTTDRNFMTRDNLT